MVETKSSFQWNILWIVAILVGWERTDSAWMDYDSEGRLIGRVWKRIADPDRRWVAISYPKQGLGCSQEGFVQEIWAKMWVEEMEEMTKERLIMVKKNYFPQDYFLEKDGLI